MQKSSRMHKVERGLVRKYICPMQVCAIQVDSLRLRLRLHKLMQIGICTYVHMGVHMGVHIGVHVGVRMGVHLSPSAAS
jgi:hypothetical protein